ncbi:Na(+)/H(+) exchange regulatory cofactor NHE-RF4, partial [Galemys pyrenaicus]
KFEFNPKLGIDNPVLSLAEDQGPFGNPCAPVQSYPYSPHQPQPSHRLQRASHLFGNHNSLPLMTSIATMTAKGCRHFLPSPPLCPMPNWVEAHPVPYQRVRVWQAQDPEGSHRPRFCLLSQDESRSFGFHLQQKLGSAGSVVCRVDPGTSAQRQGLRVGDVILGVNREVVEHEDYAVAVRHIRASGPRVLLTVLAEHVHEVAHHQQSDAHLCPTLGPGVRPRLCHVVRDEGGFGFSVTHGCRGSFWLVLSAGGAAERAGVPPGARLLEVNGVSLEKVSHIQLSKKLWQSGKQVTLLVAGPEVEEECRRRGIPLAAPLAEGWALPSKPRCLNLEKGPRGFGFLLKEEKGLEGRFGQFLWEVEPGLPAEKAGMQAGDRLVAVAGESVEGLRHEEIVSRIRAQGSRVSLTVVDPEADRFFSMVRLSPLLFLESTEDPASPQDTSSATLVEIKDPLIDDTTVCPVPFGSRQCQLYPGPGGGYGFRLCCVANVPHLFISQVTLGGSAARAGLQTGDMILEVNGCAVSGEKDLERLQQLAEAEPPLCLTLVARSQQGLEAWISPGFAEVRKKKQM